MMDKSAIRNFSIEARKILMKSAETEAGFYGVTRKGCKKPIQKGNGFEVYETLAGTENRIYGADIKKRANLVEAVETLGFDQVIEETAYTWFNRIIAIRFMEVNGYLPTRVRVLSSETGSSTPDIVTQSLDVDLNMTTDELEKIQSAKDENRYDDAFRILFVKQCNELNAILPGLFEKTDDYMELLLKLPYTSDGVVRMLVDTVAEDNFNVETEGQIEIIGWMYQYYNTELKEDTFAKLKKNVKITKERIPAATQLFTPDWIVRYMVENSVGRVWIEHLRAVDSSVDEKSKAEEFDWKYYLPEAEQEEEIKQKLVEIRKSYLNLEPKDITCIDPCMGSGHILVYMFDVLMDIYKSEGFSERDAAFSILDHNIRGLDIDRRAYQLSYFALMMKAREYNRLFFRGVQNEDGGRRFVEPIVFAIEQSNDINRKQLKYFGAGLDAIEKNNALNQVNRLLDSFVDAREYGSILNIKDFDWELLHKFIENENTEDQISFDTLGIETTKRKLIKLIHQGYVMWKKYNAVITNPPYMSSSSMGKKLTQFAVKHYPSRKSDMFAIFIEKCKNYTKFDGCYAMITQQAWMFITSYESLRAKLNHYDLVNMIHLGARAFDEISGEIVQTVAFVFRNEYVPNYIGTYCRSTEGKSESEKRNDFLNCNEMYYVAKNKFELIPEAPYIYWMSTKMIKAFEKGLVIDKLLPKTGVTTGNNEVFLRYWSEVDFSYIDKKWFRLNKGGSFRKWYGNNEFVIDWENKGEKIKKNPGSTIRNEAFYFREGITWGKICSGTFSARLSESNRMFDAVGLTCFSDNIPIEYVLGYLCSKVSDAYAKMMNPTLSYTVGTISNLPFIYDKSKSDRVVSLVIECIDIAQNDYNDMEFSMEFMKNPLIKYTTDGLISTAFANWNNECIRRIRVMKNNEEKINELFIEIFELKDDLIPSVKDGEITLHRANLSSDIKDFVSYAVGCMFGRYSLDEEGITYAGGRWGDSKFFTFSPDKDGIIPINDAEYFKDDIVFRFEEFVRKVFGDEIIEDNLDFIAKALKNKGNTSREIIRNYFLNDFFKDHCNTYSVTGSGKRPIYWLFDSGKQNGFKCLVYIHRYTKDTLNLIRSEYLHKTEDAVENVLKNAEYIIQTSSSAVEKAKAIKDRDKYVKKLNEMRIYYQALSHLAIQKIEIDLDDGVKKNYQLFQGIEVIVDGGRKQIVDLLAKI